MSAFSAFTKKNYADFHRRVLSDFTPPRVDQIDGYLLGPCEGNLSSSAFACTKRRVFDHFVFFHHVLTLLRVFFPTGNAVFFVGVTLFSLKILANFPTVPRARFCQLRPRLRSNVLASSAYLNLQNSASPQLRITPFSLSQTPSEPSFFETVDSTLSRVRPRYGA
jgi:hypothetical protein